MVKFNTHAQAMEAWAQDRPYFEARGVILPGVMGYVWEEAKRNVLALDAVPTLQATAPNSGIPSWLTTFIDPDIYQAVFAPLRAAEIFGEKREGTWVTQTAMFPIVEQTGEVSSYGDYNNNGRAGANINWPQRQSYLFQIFCEYGELEVERAGLGKINWVGEIDNSAIGILNRYMNLSYFKGVYGLQNFGLQSDPNLSAALTPAPKTYGGNKWTNNGVIVASANEIFLDIQSLWIQLVSQTLGVTQTPDQIDADAKMTLALDPVSMTALTATNSFGVNVKALLKENFPNLKVISASQYQALSALNPQGNPAGNQVQLILDSVAGQDVGFCAFNERLRAHPIVREPSAWKKKMTSGTWGAVIRFPAGISQMVGI